MAMNPMRPKGFTIFFAMLVGSLVLAIGLAIFDLTVRELDLSSTATQSQYAIYAADTGAECGLYWDLKCTLSTCPGGSAFATSSASVTPPDTANLTCNNVSIVGTGNRVVTSNPTSATTTFTVNFSPQPYCVVVQVEKRGTPTQTIITAHGYNTCATGAPNRLERVLQVTY